MLSIEGRRADFHALHEAGYFLLPTAWDIGTAKRLETLGFAGFTSSNVSLAWTLGREGGQVTRDEVLAHLRHLVNATELAVNGDFGSGFAADTKELTANVRLAIDTGVAALSINDALGTEFYNLQQAVARIGASRDAIAASGSDVLLVGRSDGVLFGRATVDETIGRLVAYSEAGADVLCAPGISDPTAITAIVEAVAPKPIDVQLMKPGIRAAALGELGVRRISVGDRFASAYWSGFERVAQHFIDFGDLLPESGCAA